MVSRRQFIFGAGGFMAASGLASGAYAVGVEPELLNVTRYNLTPRGWPKGQLLRVCVLADIHACEPWMSASRIASIARLANSLNPDLTVILGDFHAGHNIVSAPVMPDQWGESLAILKAPLGVYAILGNHDMWHGPLPKMPSDDGESVRVALKYANIHLLENRALQLEQHGQKFWLLGLADQLAYFIGRGRFRGLDDLSGTMAQITDNAPALLLAHEPNIFGRVPDRISLTLCGHTHGGQVNLPVFGTSILGYGHKFKHTYGHINENGREMIISGGLGTSIAPIRIGSPPEILDLRLGEIAVS